MMPVYALNLNVEMCNKSWKLNSWKDIIVPVLSNYLENSCVYGEAVYLFQMLTVISSLRKYCLEVKRKA